MKKIKLRLFALLGAFVILTPSFATYAANDVEYSSTESDSVHDELPYKKIQPSGYTSNFTPTIKFFKCTGNTSTSLTFALSAYYTKDVIKNGKVVKELAKPDAFYYECKDLSTGEIIQGTWNTGSLSTVTLALDTKTEYAGKKIRYKKDTFLANGITSSGNVSGGYTISGLTPGHKYSVMVQAWNKGSHCIVHYEEKEQNGKTVEVTTPCTYFDNRETTLYKAKSTANAATAPKNGDIDAEAMSTRINGINAKDQTVYVAWNKNSGIDKYSYLVSALGSNGEFSEYKGNYRGNANPTVSGAANGAYIKVKANTVNKLTVYATGSTYGLKAITNTLGAEKVKATKYSWFLAPTTNSNTAKAIEIIPQVQVKGALNKNNKIKVQWQKITGLASSDKYVIYCSVANNINTFKKVATVSSSKSSYTITKVGSSKIDSKKNYCVYVVAVDSSVDLPDDDVDIEVEQKTVKSLVNYSYRATANGKPALIGKR